MKNYILARFVLTNLEVYTIKINGRQEIIFTGSKDIAEQWLISINNEPENNLHPWAVFTIERS